MLVRAAKALFDVIMHKVCYFVLVLMRAARNETVLRLTKMWPKDYGSNWNLEVFVFVEGTPENTEKTLGVRTRTNNKLNPHMTPAPKIKPGSHWLEASALTTAMSLLQ